ncbi:MAG: Ig-like domain-containing protein [Gemmatimonadaceae bacterium]|nr:Ig-like domain-containing protein [Gemmatimonadaceae bacterium]
MAIIAASACGGSTEPQDNTSPATVELSSDTATTYPDATSYLPTVTVFNRSHQAIQHAVTWTSANSSIATIDGIHVDANAIGTVVLTATSGNASGTYSLKVVREPVTRVTVTPNGAELYGLDSIELHAVAGGPSHDSLPGRAVAFAALDPGIATVSSTGVVHLHGSGNARITATSEGFVDTVGIAADARVVKTITVLPASLNIVPGANAAPWIYHTYDLLGTELPNRIPVAGNE